MVLFIQKRRKYPNRTPLFTLLFKGYGVWKPLFVKTDVRLIQRFPNLLAVWVTTLLYSHAGKLPACWNGLGQAINELPGHRCIFIKVNIGAFSLLPPWMCLTASITAAFSRRNLAEAETKGCAATGRKVGGYDKTSFTGMTDPWNCTRSPEGINIKKKEEMTNCNLFLLSTVRYPLTGTDLRSCTNSEEWEAAFKHGIGETWAWSAFRQRSLMAKSRTTCTQTFSKVAAALRSWSRAYWTPWKDLTSMDLGSF